MITLATGYYGFRNVGEYIKFKLGNLGEPSMKELFVFGSSKYPTNIVFSSEIPNPQKLAYFFAKYTGLSAEPKVNLSVSNKYWLSLSRDLREDAKLSAKIIIMVYSSLNNLIVWG